MVKRNNFLIVRLRVDLPKLFLHDCAEIFEKEHPSAIVNFVYDFVHLNLYISKKKKLRTFFSCYSPVGLAPALLIA